ncbi:MAG TPA: transposase family protein [Streptosporangiaceae bacterium]|nr:transposase family protein [Streptosporangiaceae bacterium]
MHQTSGHPPPGLILVGFSPPRPLAAIARHLGWPGRVLADEQRLLYRRLKIGRAPLWQVYSPRTLATYAGALAHGRRLARSAAQPLEFDGVDRRGSWCHVPDMFARRADGSSWLLDVKNPQQLEWPKVRLQAERTARVCQRLGWDYEMVGELAGQRWANVSWLSGYGPDHYVYHGRPKTYWLYELAPGGIAALAAGFDSPVLAGRRAPDFNALEMGGEHGLLDYLGKVADHRKPKGVRHDLTAILAVIVVARLSGADSVYAAAPNLTLDT